MAWKAATISWDTLRGTDALWDGLKSTLRERSQIVRLQIRLSQEKHGNYVDRLVAVRRLDRLEYLYE
jgi:hypothetical protein